MCFWFILIYLFVSAFHQGSPLVLSTLTIYIVGINFFSHQPVKYNDHYQTHSLMVKNLLRKVKNLYPNFKWIA